MVGLFQVGPRGSPPLSFSLSCWEAQKFSEAQSRVNIHPIHCPALPPPSMAFPEGLESKLGLPTRERDGQQGKMCDVSSSS